MKTFVPEWLKETRMDDATLETILGFKGGTLKALFNATRTPSLAQLDIISKKLNISIDDLVYRDPTKEVPETEEFIFSNKTELPELVTYLNTTEESFNTWLTDHVISEAEEVEEDDFELTDSSTTEEVAERLNVPLDSLESWIMDNMFPDLEDDIDDDDGSVTIPLEDSDSAANRMVVPTHLDEWMLERGVHAKDLSEHLGAPVDKIIRWMKHEEMPTLVEMMAIAQSMELTMDDILYRSPTESSVQQMSQHVVETRNIHIATHLQQYFAANNITYAVTALLSKNEETHKTKVLNYMIQYETDHALEPAQIIAISMNPLYADMREKATTLEERTAGMYQAYV